MSRYLTNLDLSLVTTQPSRDPEMKFPCKLYRMLMETESQGLAHIVSWHKDGTCFRVHKQQAFVEEILPKYFKKSKYRSFQRQCNLYRFHLITAVKPFWDSCYYHPIFIKGDDDCCKKVTRPLRTNKAATKNNDQKEIMSPLSLSLSVTSGRVDTQINSENPIPNENANDTSSSIPVVDDYSKPNRATEGGQNPLSVEDKRITLNRRSSYQELCQTILGEDCPLCEDNGEQLVENIIRV